MVGGKPAHVRTLKFSADKSQHEANQKKAEGRIPSFIPSTSTGTGDLSSPRLGNRFLTGAGLRQHAREFPDSTRSPTPASHTKSTTGTGFTRASADCPSRVSSTSSRRRRRESVASPHDIHPYGLVTEPSTSQESQGSRFFNHESISEQFSHAKTRFNQLLTRNSAKPSHMSTNEPATNVRINGTPADTNGSNSASKSSLTGLTEALKDGLEHSWSLVKVLLRLSLVLIFLFLTWSCIESSWPTLQQEIHATGTTLTIGMSNVTSALKEYLSQLHHASSQSSPQTELSPGNLDPTSQPIVADLEDAETLAELQAAEEALDALKLQISLMEKTLENHGRKLEGHDASIHNLHIESKKIEEAIQSKSSNQNLTDEIIAKVHNAVLGKAADGIEASLKSLLPTVEAGLDRITEENGEKVQMMAETVEQKSQSWQSDAQNFQASIQQLNLIVNELKDNFQENEVKQKGQLEKWEENFSNFKTVFHSELIRLEEQGKLDKSEILKLIDSLEQSLHVPQPEMDVNKLQDQLVHKLVPKLSGYFKKITTETVTFEEVKVLIKNAIDKYDADKTGLPDLALESAGGSILSTRSTQSSEWKKSVVSILGIPLWSLMNTPRTIIRPGVVPGECWSFDGNVGQVVIKLAAPAIVTGFTLEHVHKSVSHVMQIDSAPRTFQVFGLISEEAASDAHDFGSFNYEDKDESLQYFPVVNKSKREFPIVELKILSNHGNPRHTCVYRFRVHGALPRLEAEHVSKATKTTS